jgi:hypothetical protein
MVQTTSPCKCFAPGGGRHADTCPATAPDLVPGYADSADGQADAADQARWDRGNR